MNEERSSHPIDGRKASKKQTKQSQPTTDKRRETKTTNTREKLAKGICLTGSGAKFPVCPISEGREGLSMPFNQTQLATCIETILSFHSFLKHGGELLKDKDKVKDYNISLWSMLVSLTKGVKRLEGSHQFKLQKFLECSHFLEDHMLYGPPSMHNSDKGSEDSSLSNSEQLVPFSLLYHVPRLCTAKGIRVSQCRSDKNCIHNDKFGPEKLLYGDVLKLSLFEVGAMVATPGRLIQTSFLTSLVAVDCSFLCE